MKLYTIGASPYGRKVIAAAAERDIDHTIQLVLVNPHERPAELVAVNPLSKVPTLVAQGGEVFVDSLAICFYLDSLGHKEPLVASSAGERFAILRQHTLAHGIMDCAVTRRVESWKTPEPDRLAFIERQRLTIIRVLDWFEREAELGDPAASKPAALDQVTLACALGFLDFRFASDGWREDRPRLAEWQAAFDTRRSMEVSRPHD